MIVPGRLFCWSSGGDGVERVVATFTVRLICAGWLPQGEVFEQEWCRRSRNRASRRWAALLIAL